MCSQTLIIEHITALLFNQKGTTKMTMIQLPEALAERLQAAAAAEGQDFNNYAVARLEKSLDTDTEEDDPVVIARIQKAMDDYDKGERGRPVEEVWAEMDAKYGPVPTKAVKGK